MSVGIGVREESSLKHFVGGRFHARDEESRREGNLFSFGKIVVNGSVDN